MSVSLGDVIAMLVALITSGIALGTTRQRMLNVEARVKTLEGEMGRLQSMAERLVRVETLLTTQVEFLKDLNANLRWNREVGRFPGDPVDDGGNGNHRR